MDRRDFTELVLEKIAMCGKDHIKKVNKSSEAYKLSDSTKKIKSEGKLKIALNPPPSSPNPPELQSKLLQPKPKTIVPGDKLLKLKESLNQQVPPGLTSAPKDIYANPKVANILNKVARNRKPIRSALKALVGIKPDSVKQYSHIADIGSRAQAAYDKKKSKGKATEADDKRISGVKGRVRKAIKMTEGDLARKAYRHRHHAQSAVGGAATALTALAIARQLRKKKEDDDEDYYYGGEY